MINGLDIWSIEFLLAIPQVPLDIDEFIKIYYNFAVNGTTGGDLNGYILMVKKSLYCLK